MAKNEPKKNPRNEDKKRIKPDHKRNSRKSKPCKRTNQPNQLAKEGKQRKGIGSKGSKIGKGSALSEIKIESGYDDDFKHSKDILLSECKEHQLTTFNSFKNRRFHSTVIRDFNAVLGFDRLHADHMPASDSRLRYKLGCLTLDQFAGLQKMFVADPSIYVYLVTIVDDRFMFNERGGTAEIYKLRASIQAAIRNHTGFNAVGVIENQIFVNHPKDREGKTFSVHAHILCWGHSNDTAALKRAAKGFKSSLTKLPIHSTKVNTEEGSIGKLGRYIVKPPYEGKEINYENLFKGKPCIRSARRVELYQVLRMFEYSAKLPILQTLFGVRDGVPIRQEIARDLTQWHAKRTSECVEIGERVYPLFESFLEDNQRLKNYKPITVNYKWIPK